MGKRQDAAKLTRRRIVEAAKKLNSEKGLSNVTVDEIVAKANVSKGSFYVYFPHKEDIAVEIAFEHFQDLEKKLKRLDIGALERISFFLKSSIDYIIGMGLPLCKEWLKGAVYPQEGVCPGLRKLSFDLDYVRSCIEEVKKAGQLQGFDSEELSNFIVSEYYGLISLWCINDGNYDLSGKMLFFAENLDVFLKNKESSIK